MDEEFKKEQLEIFENDLEVIEDEIVMLTHQIQMLDLERKQAAENLGQRQSKRSKVQMKIKKLIAEDIESVE